MQPLQNSRIDLIDLKAQIVKNLGAEKSKRYFDYLDRLLSQKLSKTEFNKLCIRVLGKENLQLHNQFIRSILRNACQAKTPPPVQVSGQQQSLIQASNSSPGRKYVQEQSGPTFQSQNQNIPSWSNGVLPVSPRKVRSGMRNQKLRDRPSPLGSNGKVECVSHQLMGRQDDNGKVVVDSDSASLCDYQRPVHHLQAAAELPEDRQEEAGKPAAERLSIHGKVQAEGAIIENGDEVEQTSRMNFFRSHLLAPLGIPFSSATIGGAHKTMPVRSAGDFVSYYDCGGLYDSETLRKRMELIAARQGLEGVSAECANMLNGVLDVYLKRLVTSCVELTGAKSRNELRKHHSLKHQLQGRVPNGLWLSNHIHTQTSGVSADFSISLLDFKVAMELNPNQLGDDWPSLLEKICTRAFE